ncbi:MAG: hypothetical protein E7631_03185 [Ruminococcaceae bacterium]|nr:hypothetical protein [Oscillospiraceae bacterium]
MFCTPNRKPVLAAVSCAMPANALAELKRLCAEVVLLPPDPLLSAPVASHADMLLFSIGDTLVVHRSYYSLASCEIDTILCCTGFHLVLTDCPRGSGYPLDVALNALLCGRYLFGRLDVLAPEIPPLAKENGITPVHIRQGYAGCSGLTAGNVILTADPSLTKAALTCGINVIPVPDKNILLPGYDHGFFGGCGGVCGDEILLCGTPNPAEYAAPIHSLALLGKSILPLSDAPLLDCGGIKFFPLKNHTL